jgi:competence protein ComEC
MGGVFLGSFFYPQIFPNYYFFFFLIPPLFILVLFYPNKSALLIGCSYLFFLGGVWMVENRLWEMKNLNQAGKEFSGEALVFREPENKDRLQKIFLNIKNQKEFSGQKILVNVPTFPEYDYGDRLKIKCILELPKNKDEKFDYQMYLAKDGIFYICTKPKIELLAENQGNKMYSFILKIKNKLQDKITKLLPAPESGLLIGLILGGDDNLSDEIKESFSKTGMSHIVAVSGYNVTIVAEYLMFLGIFLGLWRRQAFWFAIGGITLFVLMTGLPSSAVRAGIMGALLMWAMKNGRLANSQNAVIFAAVVMLFFNPLLLRWDIGFQLSFLATLGIVYFYPLVEKYSVEKQGISFLSEILFLTLSAQIFVLPVILNNFQKLSLISPLANLLVLPIVPITMFFGFITIILSFVFLPLATLSAWVAFLFLKYETSVIIFLASLKFSSVEVLNFSWVWVVIWYIILTGFIIFSKRTRKNINNQNELVDNVLK